MFFAALYAKNNVSSYDGILFSHKRTDILMHTTAWMNLENMMLSEKEASTKDHIV